MGPEDSHKVKDSCDPQTKISEGEQLHGVTFKVCSSWGKLQSFLGRPCGSSVDCDKTLISLLQQSRAAEKKKLVRKRVVRTANKSSACVQPSHQGQHCYNPTLNLLLQKSRALEGIKLKKWQDCKQKLLAQKHGICDPHIQKSSKSESIRLKKWHDGKKTIPTQKHGGGCSVQVNTTSSWQDVNEAISLQGEENGSSLAEPVVCLQLHAQEDLEKGTVEGADRDQAHTSTQDSTQASSSSSTGVKSGMHSLHGLVGDNFFLLQVYQV